MTEIIEPSGEEEIARTIAEIAVIKMTRKGRREASVTRRTGIAQATAD
jgi:hypothetical protein